jgi:hypothetical protein
VNQSSPDAFSALWSILYRRGENRMQRAYLLPLEHHAIPLASLRYPGRQTTPGSRVSDPAASLMVDLQRDAVLTITEDTDIEIALDAMFRLGARLFLVVRASAVVGVLSIQDVRRSQSVPSLRCEGIRRVADVMVPCPQAPAIDWLTLQRCCIGDLAEIFGGCGAQYLMVVEDETPKCSRVRGLIPRERVGLA